MLTPTTAVCMDDIWAAAARAPNGSLVPDLTRFPNGMKVVADYMHERGLKLGMYAALGNHTCSHKMPGSYGKAEADARLFADWGVDLVKIDTCIDPTHDHPLGDNDLHVTIPAYMKWSQLLKADGNRTGRH